VSASSPRQTSRQETDVAARTLARFLERELGPSVAWDLSSLAPRATSLLDVTVTGCRQGDLAHAALASSTRFLELNAAAWRAASNSLSSAQPISPPAPPRLSTTKSKPTTPTCAEA
jgi:hypothetical protein